LLYLAAHPLLQCAVALKDDAIIVRILTYELKPNSIVRKSRLSCTPNVQEPMYSMSSTQDKTCTSVIDLD
jgi:hypothetical protein